MSISEVILSADFILALSAYAIIIVVAMPLLEQVYPELNHQLLQWQWRHIAMPLIQAAMMVLFILLSYPVLYGIKDAPAIASLLARDDLRINYLINLLFIISLFFPLVPFVGGRHELVLPLQGIAACMMVFSWLAASLSVSDYSFWPGWEVVGYCLVLAIVTYWIGIKLAQIIGHQLDGFYHVKDSGELLARGLVLFMQSPVILIYSAALGRQLY